MFYICFQVGSVLLIVMQSAHLVAQRKAFQQSMEDVLTLSREQTSSQPLIASALEELKVLMVSPDDGCTSTFTSIPMRLLRSGISARRRPTFSVAFHCSCLP